MTTARLVGVVVGIIALLVTIGLVNPMYSKDAAKAAHKLQTERFQTHKVQSDKDHARIEKQHRDDVTEMKKDLKTILRAVRRRR